jgi:catechol 2,3-dioxygenase-like lactoylglutathione lyase family enzyme
VELLLEPNAHPATQAHQSALYADGIPHAQFFVDDIEAVYDRLRARGVRFKGPPARMGDAKAAIFDDTCGNWIILTQELPIEDAASE